MKETLTIRQKDALDTIKKHVEEYGVCPSYSELAENMGLSSKSTFTAQRYMEELERKGYIKRHFKNKRHAHRSIIIL